MPERNQRVDPTANVLSLVGAAMQRQDDLRIAEFRRIDDLRMQSEKCAHEIAEIQIHAQRDMAVAESRRIDALLHAAANTVALASEKSSAQAAALAQQVATAAETRAAQISQLRDSLEKRIASLEQMQYQTGGASAQRTESRGQSNWVIGLLVGVGMGVLAFLISVIVR